MKTPLICPRSLQRKTIPFLSAVFVMVLFVACGGAPKQAEPQSAAAQSEGAAVYSANCSSCHLPGGEGVAGMAPAMEDSPAVQDDDPRELIRAILHGVGGKAFRGQQYPSRMPGFGQFLKDEEIAAVVNYSRIKWGRGSGGVTAADVQKERQQP